jgi:MATE family multidrug resistance protein
MVSQAYGRNDVHAQLEFLQKGLLIALLAGILLVLLQLPIQWLSLLILNADTVIEPLLREYISYRIWAAPATISVYVFTGWFLGMQDSRSALALAITVNGMNALLSFLFVYSFEWEISGVAMGTVLAQYLGLLSAFFILSKKYDLPLLKVVENIRSSASGSWKEFIKVNSDILIRTLCLIFTLSFFKAKAANIDPILGAANILLMEFITISAYGIDGFAFAAESISGKYFGKRNVVMLLRSVRYSFFWGILLAIGLAVVFLLFGRNILELLTDKQNVVEAAMPFLFWLILAPLVNITAFIWDGVYIGTTSSASMRNTMLISTLLIFLPAYFMLFPIYQNHGLWLALTLFMFSRGVFLSLLFKSKVISRIS